MRKQKLNKSNDAQLISDVMGARPSRSLCCASRAAASVGGTPTAAVETTALPGNDDVSPSPASCALVANDWEMTGQGTTCPLATFLQVIERQALATVSHKKTSE